MIMRGFVSRRDALISLLASLAFVGGPAAADMRIGTGDVRLIDRPLLDSRGRRLSFKRDVLTPGPVILSFTFTGCNVICPSVDLTIDAVVRSFENQGSARPAFATLTLDPLNDGPAQLAERAAAMAPERLWLTGAPQDVFAILDGLNVQLGRLEDHDLAIFVIGQAGRDMVRLNGLASVDQILAAHKRVLRA